METLIGVGGISWSDGNSTGCLTDDRVGGAGDMRDETGGGGDLTSEEDLSNLVFLAGY